MQKTFSSLMFALYEDGSFFIQSTAGSFQSPAVMYIRRLRRRLGIPKSETKVQTSPKNKFLMET